MKTLRFYGSSDDVVVVDGDFREEYPLPPSVEERGSLRETAVEACADRTESTEGLADCVTATIKATGQKP